MATIDQTSVTAVLIAALLSAMVTGGALIASLSY
jgi:hypothetical protein